MPHHQICERPARRSSVSLSSLRTMASARPRALACSHARSYQGKRRVSITCAYRKLHPAILMVKSAEDRPSNELAKPLYRPTARRILVQGEVRSAFVVIAGVGRRDPAQVPLAEDNGMIEALPADRADQSLRVPVLP